MRNPQLESYIIIPSHSDSEANGSDMVLLPVTFMFHLFI